MKFVQNNKILEDSNAESAEISAEKTKNKLSDVFSALPLRSLRLCVEGKAGLL